MIVLALRRLSSMYGEDVVHNHTVVNYVATRWLSNPRSLGSYSYATVGTLKDFFFFFTFLVQLILSDTCM